MEGRKRLARGCGRSRSGAGGDGPTRLRTGLAALGAAVAQLWDYSWFPILCWPVPKLS